MSFTYAEIVEHALSDGRPACVPCAEKGLRMVGWLHPPDDYERWMCYDHWIEHLHSIDQIKKPAAAAIQDRLW